MAEKICPSYPQQKGVPGIVQDGMSDAGSAEQANKAGKQKSIASEDKDED